jgi:hypothetical protein
MIYYDVPDTIHRSYDHKIRPISSFWETSLLMETGLDFSNFYPSQRICLGRTTLTSRPGPKWGRRDLEVINDGT